MAKKNPDHLPLVGICLLAAVIAGGICVALYSREAGQIEKDLRFRESTRIETRARLLAGDLQSVANDLHVLSTGDGLRAYVESSAPADFDRVVQRAIFFAKMHADYDQLRYLDENGREVMRVNQGGVVVPIAQLQDKAGRNYFRHARNLAPGQIFISAFDLNQENGRIEEPLKPMLRFSTPVVDTAGKQRGVYVINYRGANIITRLQQTSPAYQHRLRLLNAGGYWLKAADPAQEWGFMLPERSGSTLARTAPSLWAQVTNQPVGQVRHKGGLFTWQRIVPAAAIAGNLPAVSEEPFLVIASEVSATERAGLFANLQQAFVIVGVILFVLITSSGWFFHQRRRSVAELNQSQALLQAILDNTPAVIFLKDVQGRYLFVNRRYEQVSSLTRSQTANKTVFDLFPKEIAEVAHANDRAVIETKTSRQFEETVTYPDGPHTHLVVKFPLFDAAGRVYALGGVSTDISERKRAQEERERFFDLSRDLICVAGFDGYFKALNPAWEATLGFSIQEILAKPFMESVHPDDRAATAAAAGKLMGGGELVSFENRYNCKDGSYRWLEWNARSVLSEQLMYATARDVTGQKQTAREISRLNTDLEQRAAQLETANKELEAFSYSVSHDLRAPLRHIDGFLDLLAKNAADKLDDRGQRYVKIIGDSAKQMGNLIDDLLVFSRMGRTEMRRQAVDMNAMVDQVISGMAPELAGRNIKWKIARLPQVEADTAMLRQVWVNLIGNAVKYTRTRDPAEIEIGTQEEKPGRQVFFVRDNGVGFDMQYVEKLFGVFQRLHRSDEFEGTGIGLANVRRIIHRHGGRTWAEGAVDRGATFYYTLH